MASERGLWHGLAGLLVSLAALALAHAAPARAEVEPSLTQYQVEAAFLYHFTKYVTWPDDAFASPSEPIVIGVLGDDPFGDELTHMIAREKPVQGRRLHVRRSRHAAELAQCHILFISASEQSRLAQHFATLHRANSHALTVGETEDFLRPGGTGGVIRFVVENNKVRFDIDAHAAARAQLIISSKLLSLARNTRGRG